MTPRKARHCRSQLPLAMGMAGPRLGRHREPPSMKPAARPVAQRRYATNGALFPTGIAGMHSFMWLLGDPSAKGALGAPEWRDP